MNCIPVVSVLSADPAVTADVSVSASVLGMGSGLSSSADMAETGSETVRWSLEIGAGAPTGETGAWSSADLWYCSLTAFAMLELAVSGVVAAPAPASGTAA